MMRTRPPALPDTSGTRRTGLGRRSFLAAAAATGTVALTSPRLAFAAPGEPTSGDAVVLVFLRGGADGLSMTPPFDHASYHDLRPTIAIPPPGAFGGALPLDATTPGVVFPTGLNGVVGLHPAMQALHDGAWSDGHLAVVPAVGQVDTTTRSHFDAMRSMERGTASSGVRTGLLNRLLQAGGADGPIPGVGSAYQAIASLEGAARTVTVPQLRSFGLDGFADRAEARSVLAALHAGLGAIEGEGRLVLDIVDQLEALKPAAEDLGSYPNTGLGRDLHDVAVMLRAGLGLRAAAVDSGGWDHHADLGAPGDTDGNFWRRARDLSDALAAFYADLSSDRTIDEVTVVVVTEFGRTINENGDRGVDHGRASSALVLGGGIRGGVFGDDYPDVIEDDPISGDLTVFTDYRKVFAEVFADRVGLAALDDVIPGYVRPPTLLGFAS